MLHVSERGQSVLSFAMFGKVAAATFSSFGPESGRVPKLLGENVSIRFEPCMVEPQYAYRWKEN